MSSLKLTKLNIRKTIVSANPNVITKMFLLSNEMKSGLITVAKKKMLRFEQNDANCSLCLELRINIFYW